MNKYLITYSYITNTNKANKIYCSKIIEAWTKKQAVKNALLIALDEKNNIYSFKIGKSKKFDTKPRLLKRLILYIKSKKKKRLDKKASQYCEQLPLNTN